MTTFSRRTLLAAGSGMVSAIPMAGAPIFAETLAPVKDVSVRRKDRIATMPRSQESVPSRPITVEDIARLPATGMNAPSAIQFAPDGKTLTYLFSSNNTLVQELWAYDLATGQERVLLTVPESPPPTEADFSFAEWMRRERLRQYALGVTDYAWGDNGNVLMARRQGEVLVRPGLEGDWRALAGSHDWVDPQLSPDETLIALALHGEVYVLSLADPNAQPRQLTFDASVADVYGDQPRTNGVAEYVAQEELGRLSGFWWSPDSSRIVFEQADLTAVPRFLISHPGTPTVDVESHRYPFAGKPIAAVRLGVVQVTGGEPLWLSLSEDADVYLARVDWTPDALVVAQVLSRDQKSLAYHRLDPVRGSVETLWEDHVEPWINFTDDLRFIHAPDAPDDDYQILWSSERSGWRELYLSDRDGGFVRQLTNHDAYIDGVVVVDAQNRWVAIQGWQESPLEQQLFRVPLAGGVVEHVTAAPGTHRCTFAPDHQSFVDLFDSTARPPAATLYQIDGNELGRLQANATPDPLLSELDLVPPEFVQVTADDGTVLHGAIYWPRSLEPGAKAPVVVNVYGGPGVQRVVNSWTMTSDLRPEALTEQGFLVFALDNRGTARRGLAFEAAVDRRLGDLEVRDQVAGILWLAENVAEADVDRVGIYGWSYGGYMSLMCLARHPEVFKAAAAGGPVTDWEEYDSCYTERYMGRHSENLDGYRESSVLTHAADIRGALLLIHGLIDENVHFRNTGRLMQEVLLPDGIPFAEITYPEERHHLRREVDRVWLERSVLDFLHRNV